MSFANWPEAAPVHELQTLLQRTVPSAVLQIDGIFGAETEAALRLFQKSHGLTENGVADQVTWDALRQANSKAQVLLGPAAPLEIILQPNQVIGRDEKNLHLYLVQAMFLALGKLFVELPAVRITGTLDRETDLALRWLQARAALEITGTLDKLTWRALVRQYRSTVGDGTGAFPYRLPAQE